MLFKDNDELRKHCRASKSLTFDSFSIYEPIAQEKYMRRFCGDELLNLMNTWYDADEPADTEENKLLLPYLQSAIAKFALALGGPDLDLVLSESGFGVVNNTNLAPASKERVANFIANQLELGYIAVEKLLRYLEKNKGDFPTWTASDAYTTKWEFLIPNSVVFSKIVDINESRKTYFDLMPHMSTAEEEHITPKLGVAFSQKLKQLQQDDDLTGEYLQAMKLAQKATAYFTKFTETNDQKYYVQGSTWLNSLVQYLQKNAEALLEFKNGEAYQSEGIKPAWENNTDNGIFVLGGFPTK